MPNAELGRLHVDVEQCDESEARRFRWLIREGGFIRVLDRTLYATERQARAAALLALQRLSSVKANPG